MSTQYILPSALEPLTKYEQFILVKFTPKVNKDGIPIAGKTDKIPVTPNTFAAHSAHDQTIWMDFNSASSLAATLGPGWGVGFTITDADPIICLDLDNCLEADGKTWAASAREMLAQFPGACEVSNSGRGLHVWATYSGVMPAHGKRNAMRNMELYSGKRFIALGSGAIGTMQDVTAILPGFIASWFAPSASNDEDSGNWTTCPCADHTPLTDDDLMRRALASRRKQDAGAVFGDSTPLPCFHDLWTRDVSVLARAYPPQSVNKDINASDADFFLAKELAYWTGKNCERIERLMQASALKRDKWSYHKSYLHDTILNGVAACKAVYSHEEKTPLVYDLSPISAFKRSERVSISDLYTNPPTTQRFLIADILPGGVVTLLGAHGGTGKSMLALIASVCLVTGRTFMGKQVEQCRVLFYSAEDPAPIIRRRLSRICQFMAIDPAVLAADLIVLDATEYPTLYAGCVMPALETLRIDVDEFAPGIIIIDNASDTYDANEIERARVREFIRLLAGLGKPNNAAVLLLAHIDKQTAKAGGGGEGYSGSTAWHNSARSRLFLSSQDGDGLILEHQKSNLGARSQPIYLKWVDGGLLELAEAPGGTDHQTTVLRLMAEAYSRGDYISPASNASNNVYKVLQKQNDYPKFLKRDGLATIVQMLVANRALTTEEYSTDHRNKRSRYAVGALSNLPQT